MPTEIERHSLYEKIKEEWGEGHADALMSHLPPVGWADVATKGDLAHLGTELRLEMAKLGSDLRREIAGVRTEVSDKIAGLQRTMISLMVLLTAIFSAITTIAAIAS